MEAQNNAPHETSGKLGSSGSFAQAKRVDALEYSQLWTAALFAVQLVWG